MTYLKPCPFCGGESHFQAQQGDNPEPFAWDVVHHCAAGGFIRMDPRDSKYRSTKAEAAAAWNTRITLSAIEVTDRDEILEEAAKVADAHQHNHSNGSEWASGEIYASTTIAADIRAMKGGEG